MGKGYITKNGNRIRFQIRVPKKLWDNLPKVIMKEITTEYQDGITEKCRRCGERLKGLFARAVKGMVNREILCELAAFAARLCSASVIFRLHSVSLSCGNIA